MSFHVDMNDPEVIESLKFLIVPKEEKIQAQTRPFDGKKNVFIPDHKEGYIAAVIESSDEKKGTTKVKTSKGDLIDVKTVDVQQMNPPKYEKCDDMADMTYLNDATVLHNLRERYLNWYIYTYSGLFCVTINPFRRLPVYTMKMVHFYRGKKKNEVPPHLYLVADNAYAAMMRDRENQSMLITGESGAGKTENTKKVIQYFAFVAAGVSGKKVPVEDANKPSLEDQIVSANPVLEAYGNAKTTRNNNSSRFGKFIRIHFTAHYGIAGADIESYLLEKSRITYQMPAERNYHIFYQICSKAFPDMVKKDLLLEHDPGLYSFINQGMLTIDKVDDEQEMKDTKKAFDILLFTEEQQLDLFKCTAAVMHWGNQKWKQKPREEQAEADGSEDIEKVAKLLGLELDAFINGLLKPKIKVGKEFVNKGQNQSQVQNACAALSKAVYARSFNWLVERVNVTLDVKTVKRAYFIGVLDIAGFETFEENGFEQLCINFTNERLQQFFNNFMFVLEQEEYAKEGIVWEMMSFGADLQATIDLIDKPMGIFSMLEEECVVPKGTDTTYKEKLYAQHLGKHPSFGKPKPSKSKYEAHFDLHHYAGTVSYSVTGWLEKNKDPINEFVAAMFKTQKNNSLLAYLFQDIGADENKKKGSQTISANHREQLNRLMKTLGATHPHFVRCIIPNEIKTGGVIDAHLVMHQLHCNGVLEGIRICRKGYPSRILYLEFTQRYSILNPDACKGVGSDKDAAKKATQAILEGVKLDSELYRIGLTKVLFKAGVLGTLEEHRDTAISRILTMFQSHIRCYLMKKNIKNMVEQKKAVSSLQRNIKAYLTLRCWDWWKLFANVKPLLQGAKREAERKAREAEEARLAAERAAEAARKAALCAQLEIENSKLTAEKEKLLSELDSLKQISGNSQEMITKLNEEKNNLELHIKELGNKISISEANAGDLGSKKRELEGEIANLNKNIQEINNKLNKSDADNKAKDIQLRKMQEEIASQDDNNAKLLKDKRRLEDLNSLTLEQLQQEEDKVAHLNKLKSQLELGLDEAEENLEREKKARADLDKIKRKLDNDLKTANIAIEETERRRKDLEDQLKRKENELMTSNANADQKASQLSQAQKKVKDLQNTVAELEEIAEAERQGRAKAEKQRMDLSRELDELNERLEEAGGATSAQLDLNKKREAELAKLRRDLEDANAQHEEASAQLRKKHQDAVTEMSQQIDQLQKAKNKLDKEKQVIRAEADDARSQIESAHKAKINADKLTKQLEQQLSDLSVKLEDSSRQLGEVVAQKAKLENVNSNLTSQLEEAENRFGGFAKVRSQLQGQIEEARRAVDEEARAKASLTQQLRNLSQDLDTARSQIDEEQTLRGELQKSLAKVTGDLQHYRSKYESETLARSEELEEAKRKLASKVTEAEEQVEQALAKCNSLEKTKQRLQQEMEELVNDVEKANANVASMEKKQKQFDKLILEWKQKCESITLELEVSQKESRQYSVEIFKLKSQYQEAQETIDAMHRENKNLADEIKDLMDQLGNGGKSVHEIQKTLKRVEIEKAELQSALEEAEGLLEQQEAKVLNAQLEVGNVRLEIERRLHEKEEEFENTRRNHARALESMQASLEAEAKGKAEAIRQKKAIEQSLSQAEAAVDQSNRANVDLQKTNKRLQQTISEYQAQVEDEQRQRNEARELLAASERQQNTLLAEIDQNRTLLEQADKARKALENDLHEVADRISELSAANSNLNSQKRKLETDLAALRADLDEAIVELRNSEDRVKKATGDAARLTEELRAEQDHAGSIEKLRKSLEQQLNDVQARLDQAENNALKGGKRIIQKLEQRILELENERDLEIKHHQESLKELRKNERALKELSFQAEEDRKSNHRLEDTIDKLQNKIKIYKRQIEEAEEIAALNLAKFRRAQDEIVSVSATNAENAQRARASSALPQRAGSVRR